MRRNITIIYIILENLLTVLNSGVEYFEELLGGLVFVFTLVLIQLRALFAHKVNHSQSMGLNHQYKNFPFLSPLDSLRCLSLSLTFLSISRLSPVTWLRMGTHSAACHILQLLYMTIRSH